MSMTDRINARIDPNLKRAALGVFEKLGITEAEAIRMFYAQVDLNQGIPFDLRLPNARTLSALQEAECPENLRSFRSIQDFEASLDDLDE